MQREDVERIWVDDERPIGGTVHVWDDLSEEACKYAVEYVRADLYAALLDRAERAEAECERLKRINREHCNAVNALNLDGARLEARLKAAEAERDAAFAAGQEEMRGRAALEAERGLATAPKRDGEMMQALAEGIRDIPIKPRP